MNLPVAFFDIFDTFSGFLMHIPTALFAPFLAFWCRYRQHFLAVFGSSENLPGVPFSHFRRFDEPTNSTFRLFWWVFGLTLQIPAVLFTYFWILDADTDITFWPFWRALIFLVQTSTALFTPFWKFGVHTRRTFHPRSTLLVNFGILYADTDNTFYLFFCSLM